MADNDPQSIDVSGLQKWLSAEHLDVGRLRGYQERLRDTAFPVAVLDDFFRPAVFDQLADAFYSDIDFQQAYRLRGEGMVDRESWYAAAESKRLYSHLQADAARSGHEMSPGFLRHLILMTELGGSAFLEYFSLFSPQTLLRGNVLARAVDPARGHSLGWHDDVVPTRTVCCVIYMNRDWEPSRGGQFAWRNAQGDITLLDPKPNRALLFTVNRDNQHRVEAMNQAAADGYRYNYTWWFYTALEDVLERSPNPTVC